MALQRVAISLGDPAGIGPEIALKAALDPRVLRSCRPVLVGDRRVLETHAALCGIAAEFRSYKTAAEVDWSGKGISSRSVAVVDLDHFGDEKLALGTIAAINGRAAVDAARTAIAAALAGHVDLVAAAPHTERSIKLAGIAFDGYPGFLARCTGLPEEDVFLMNCFDDKRIVHVTLHVGIARVLELITRERVGKTIAAADRTLRRLGIAAPRIGVSGLNPHAGEEGLFGDEEIVTIGPAVEDAKAAGIRAEGPFGADTMFNMPGYDAFVVMFHDQGHIPAKLLAPNRVAAIAIGAPVLFSSVAHGSALDIAGQGKASHEAVVEAIGRLIGAAESKAA
jgi:4-hydroxy-L-threonine phosphate dehydrogenase PdxA